MIIQPYIVNPREGPEVRPDLLGAFFAKLDAKLALAQHQGQNYVLMLSLENDFPSDDPF